MFSAYPDLEIRSGGTAFGDSLFYEPAYRRLVNMQERVKGEDLLLDVSPMNDPISSLEKPKVICVRSFVPNEKN